MKNNHPVFCVLVVLGFFVLSGCTADLFDERLSSANENYTYTNPVPNQPNYSYSEQSFNQPTPEVKPVVDMQPRLKQPVNKSSKILTQSNVPFDSPAMPIMAPAVGQ